MSEPRRAGIQLWLHSAGLERFYPQFLSMGINEATFANLTFAQIDDIGITDLNDRKKLNRLLKVVRNEMAKVEGTGYAAESGVGTGAGAGGSTGAAASSSVNPSIAACHACCKARTPAAAPMG